MFYDGSVLLMSRSLLKVRNEQYFTLSHDINHYTAPKIFRALVWNSYMQMLQNLGNYFFLSLHEEYKKQWLTCKYFRSEKWRTWLPKIAHWTTTSDAGLSNVKKKNKKIKKRISGCNLTTMWSRGLYSTPIHTDIRQCAYSLQDQAFTQVPKKKNNKINK